MAIELRNKISLDASGMDAGIRAAEAKLKSLQRSVNEVGSSFGALLPGLGAIGAASGLAMLGKQAIDAGAEIKRMSLQLNTSVESVQRLKYIAEQTGTPVEAVVKALNKLAVAAAQGDQKHLKAFQDLNLDIQKFNSLNPEQRLFALADAFSKSAKDGKDLGDVNDLLGKNYNDLIPVLSHTGSELRKIGEEAVIMGESTVEAMESAHKTLSRFGDQVTVVAADVVELTKDMLGLLNTTSSDQFLGKTFVDNLLAAGDFLAGDSWDTYQAKLVKYATKAGVDITPAPYLPSKTKPEAHGLSDSEGKNEETHKAERLQEVYANIAEKKMSSSEKLNDLAKRFWDLQLQIVETESKGLKTKADKENHWQLKFDQAEVVSKQADLEKHLSDQQESKDKTHAEHVKALHLAEQEYQYSQLSHHHQLIALQADLAAAQAQAAELGGEASEEGVKKQLEALTIQKKIDEAKRHHSEIPTDNMRQVGAGVLTHLEDTALAHLVGSTLTPAQQTATNTARLVRQGEQRIHDAKNEQLGTALAPPITSTTTSTTTSVKAPEASVTPVPPVPAASLPSPVRGIAYALEAQAWEKYSNSGDRKDGAEYFRIRKEREDLERYAKMPSLQGKADGGFVSGNGSATSDSIPTMLSNGEYVINARAAAKIGRSQLDQINHFANGGSSAQTMADWGVDPQITAGFLKQVQSEQMVQKLGHGATWRAIDQVYKPTESIIPTPARRNPTMPWLDESVAFLKLRKTLNDIDAMPPGSALDDPVVGELGNYSTMPKMGSVGVEAELTSKLKPHWSREGGFQKDQARKEADTAARIKASHGVTEMPDPGSGQTVIGSEYGWGSVSNNPFEQHPTKTPIDRTGPGSLFDLLANQDGVTPGHLNAGMKDFTGGNINTAHRGNVKAGMAAHLGNVASAKQFHNDNVSAKSRIATSFFGDDGPAAKRSGAKGAGLHYDTAAALMGNRGSVRSNGMQDHSASIAANTKETNRLLGQLVEKLNKPASAPTVS